MVDVLPRWNGWCVTKMKWLMCYQDEMVDVLPRWKGWCVNQDEMVDVLTKMKWLMF